jgi:hypothetical protein
MRTSFVRLTLVATLVGAGTLAGARPGSAAADAANAAAATRAEPVTVRGVFERLVVETAGGHDVRYTVRSTDASWWLENVSGSVPAPGSEVEVTGTPTDAYTLAVDSIEVVDDARAQALAAAAPRSTRVLVARVYWSARPPARPNTETTRRRVLADSQAWFREVSHGRYSVSGTVSPWLRIAHPGDCYGGSYRARDETIAAVRRAGYDLSQYQRLVIYLPCDAGGILGMANMPGPVVWMFGNLMKGTIMHEQGHNLGLPHASSRVCVTARWGAATWSSRCQRDEYGDGIDTMGNRRSGHFSAAYKSRLGWLLRSTTVTRSGTVRLTPYEKSGPGLKAARLQAGGRTYWLEYRTRTGADRSLPKGADGVQIRLQGDDGQIELLDAAPGSPGGWDDFGDSHLPEGSSWTTPENVRITVTGQSRAAATVAIRFGTRPRAPGSVRRVTTVAGVDSVLLRWRRPADNGSIIRRYEITRVPDGATRNFVTTGGTTTSYRWTGLRPNRSYRFAVRAVSQEGRSAAVRSRRVRTLDDRPSVAIGAPSPGTRVQGFVPIRYAPRPNRHTRQPIQYAVVYVDGRQESYDWSAPWEPFRWDTRGLANGRHTIRVTVTDQANRSATKTVSVDVRNPTQSVRIVDPSAGESVVGIVDVDYALAPAQWDWQSIELLVDGSPTDWASPGEGLSFDATWLDPGPHTLRVRATNPWRTVTSAPVTVTIPTPTVRLTSPAAGATLAGQVEVEYALAPAGWAWQGVTLTVDGSPWSSAAPGDPLTFDTTSFAPGPHTLRVSATDGQWRSYESAAISVTFAEP